MSSSNSESDNETSIVTRLGECEVCGANSAKYTCPKCEVKTCCLKCVIIHKKELECDGIRNGTKFIRIKDFTDTDLLNDYRMLEECSRFIYGMKIGENMRYNRIDKDLPIHLFKLKMAARKRGIVLQFLAQHFTRHVTNTTRYNYKTNIIHWRVEWVFPNADCKPLKFVDEKCPEHVPLSELLDKYLNCDAMPFEGSKSLIYYKSVGFSGVKVLLKAEKVKCASRKFFELDPTETLSENLSGKCIIEFPIIFVVLKDHAYNFDIVTPEEEFDYEKNDQTNSEPKENITNNEESSDKTSKPDTSVAGNNQEYQANRQQNFNSRKRPRQLLTEKIAKEKKLEIEKEIKEQRRKKPKNLLFTTGYSSEESLGNSDGETT